MLDSRPPRLLPSTPAQADALLARAEQLASAGSREEVDEALGLFARWARMQPVPASPAVSAVLHRAASLASLWLRQGQQSGALVLLAGSISKGLAVDDALQLTAVLQRLLTAGHATEPAASSVAAGTLQLVAATLPEAPQTACSLFAALLSYLAAVEALPLPTTSLDDLAPMYGGMREAATETLASSGRGPGEAVASALRPAYAVLRDAGPITLMPAAAALGLGGLVEGLLRGAPGYSEAQQLVAEAEADVLAACDAAAAATAMAADSYSTRSSTLVDACSLATVQLQQALRRPPMTSGVFRCQATALLHSALSLQPLCASAAAGDSPAAATEQLRQHLNSSLGLQAGSLARGLTHSLPTMDANTLGWLLEQLRKAARQTASQYAAYSMQTHANWMQAVDPVPVRQLLERHFLSCLLLLEGLWETLSTGPHNAQQAKGPGLTSKALPSSPEQQQAQLASDVAAVLSDLQFCRLPAEQYSSLLNGVLAALPGSPAAAAALAGCLPCYADLAQPCPALANAPQWVVDGVTAAKVQFLFTLLTTCCSSLPETLATDRVAPLVFLYLLHPHPPTSAAAQSLFCALITSLPEAQREPLAPFYVKRSLEGCPGPTLVLQLGQGLAAIMQALPASSPVLLLCLERVLDHCRQLAGDPGQAPLLQELFAVACQALLAIPHMLLDGAIGLMDDCLQAVPPQALGSLQPVLFDCIARSDDCVRKPSLAAWYQQHLAAMYGSSPMLAPNCNRSPSAVL